jgi:hypothetical protein
MTAALPQMARSFGASLLRRYGFRRVLLVNGTLTSLACADAIDPYTVIAIVLFASGLTRSLQFSALNSPAFADVPSEQTGAANTLANVVQQLTFGFGVATAAAAVHLASLLSHDAATGPTLTDFRTPLWQPLSWHRFRPWMPWACRQTPGRSSAAIDVGRTTA